MAQLARRVAVLAALAPLPILMPVSAATAAEWRPAETLSRVSGGNVTLADLDVGPRGDAVATWVQTRPGGYQVRVATRRAHGGWSQARALTGWFRDGYDGPLSYGGRPQAAIDGRGVATVAWSQAYGGTVRVRAATRSASGRWSAPHWLSAKGKLGVNPRLATSAAGTVLFWQQGRPFGDPRLLSRYRPRGGTWERTTRLDEKTFVQIGPAQAVVDPAGRAVVTWDEERQSRCCAGRVRVATYVPGSGWTLETLFQRSNHSHQPQIDLADNGTVTIAWPDYDKILVSHRPPDGAWTLAEQVVLLGDSVAPDVVGVGTTDAGATMVGWTRLDLDNGRRGDVLSVQASPGAPWTRERVSRPASEPFFTPFFPSLAVAEDGGATMTWQVQVADPDRWYRVYSRHRHPDGTWGKPVRMGRVTGSETLGVDDRGTVTALWLAGGRRNGEVGCCWTVQSRVLPAG
jgi:hypothetical protein